MALVLDKAVVQQAKQALRTYFEEKLELELGHLDAELLLEFVVKTVGPSIYNRAIKDAQDFLQDKLLDLEAQLYES
jgi:uncharacterized protein (DUF2164 family)